MEEKKPGGHFRVDKKKWQARLPFPVQHCHKSFAVYIHSGSYLE